MEIAPLTKLSAYIFLVITMLGIGLKVTGREVLQTLRYRSLILRSLLVNIVFVPILGLIVTTIVPMPIDTEVGILLLAAAPGGLAAIQFTSKGKESLTFAASLLFILSVVAIFVTPLTAELILPIHTPMSLPYLRVIQAMIFYLLFPLLIGFAVQRLSGRVAQALSTPVTLCGTLSFIAMIILTMAMKRQAVRAIGGSGMAAMIILIIVSMVIGWVLGGPDKNNRRVLATGTSMRNAAICLLIAQKRFPDTSVDVAVVAFSALMVPPNMLFALYEIIKNKCSEKRRGA
jgi:BASS family bile acid:Na+ symporter